MPKNPDVRRLLLIVLTVLAGAAVTVVVSSPDEHGHRSITVSVGSARSSDVAHHDGLRDETPGGVDPRILEAGRQQQERLAFSDQLPIVTPDAAPAQRGCRTRLVQNFSSRRGVAPRLEVAHYTVSHNVTGWGDVDAIVGLFDQASFQASSNFVIDAEGNCAYIVRTSDKAWTQAAANPVSISIEFVAMGNEGRLSAAAVAKGARVFADQGRLWKIPARLGSISGCVVQRGGIVDHAMLGECGGGHHDLKPFGNGTTGPTSRAQDAVRLGPLVRATAALAGGPSAVDRRTCSKLEAWRRNARPGGHQLVVNVARRRALDARNVVCTPNGAVKK